MGNVANLKDEVKKLQAENKRLTLDNQQLRNENQTQELTVENKQLKRDIKAYEYLADARGREIAVKKELLKASDARVQSAMLFIIALMKRLLCDVVEITKQELVESHQAQNDIKIDFQEEKYLITMVQPANEQGSTDQGGIENVKGSSSKRQRSSKKTVKCDAENGTALN
jgi:hypothetical protein